jgi:hypothetical protein
MTINDIYRNNKDAITSHYLMTLPTARLTIEPLIYYSVVHNIRNIQRRLRTKKKG